MDSFVTFQTKNNIKYIFNSISQEILISHPILEYLVKYHEKYKKLNFPKFENVHDKELSGFSEDDYLYYITKYNFLDERGFFKIFDNKQNYKGKINEHTIVSNFANARQLTFEVTERCNLNCVYCGFGQLYSNNQSRKNRDLKFVDAKAIIDKILELKRTSDTISVDKKFYISFYGGEPLLNMKLIKEIVQYVEVSNNGLFNPIFSMTTNGILLKEHIKYLVDNDFKILISLDGNKKNNGFRITKNKKDCFNLIINNINYIKEKYNIFFKNNISFNSVLHSKNSVEEIYDFIFNNYKKVPSISVLNTNGVNKNFKDKFIAMFNGFENSLSKSNKNKRDEIETHMFVKHPKNTSIHRFLYSNCNFAYLDYNEIIFKPDKTNILPTATCQQFSKKIFVTANGSILPCERVGTSEFFGKVNEGEIVFDYSAFVNGFNEKLAKIKPKCQVCYLSGNCPQCIYYTDNGKYCDSFMTKNKFADYLSKIVGDIESSKVGFKQILNEITIDL